MRKVNLYEEKSVNFVASYFVFIGIGFLYCGRCTSAVAFAQTKVFKEYVTKVESKNLTGIHERLEMSTSEYQKLKEEVLCAWRFLTHHCI